MTLQDKLPEGIRSRTVPNVNGLQMHVLEAGQPGDPLLLLLHGFPELAYSWRHVMVPLAQAGYFVVAPDQRGYGATTGWDDQYATNLQLFGMQNLVLDTLCLVSQLGYAEVACVVGHDFGAPVAAYCALIRGDVFLRMVHMSAPFAGPPPVQAKDRSAVIARLADAGRQHYQWYFSQAGANQDLMGAPQGMHRFLRAYYHVKSADWPNQPYPLQGWDVASLAELPTYYVMPVDKDMPSTVSADEPDGERAWLTDEELNVYVQAFTSSGFQGGLNWYRCATSFDQSQRLALYAGWTIDVPSGFIAGRADWGVYQTPGAYERMPQVCTNLQLNVLIDGAGHWVQQEQPSQVIKHLLDFLNG